MKIAIHHREKSFSSRWIAYLDQHQIKYKLVNAYANDIIQQVEGCDAFMWHFYHVDYRDMKFAKSLIQSLETAGIKCFPNSNTCWHFDDKVAQKYLLEAVGAPLVPSYVFYSEKEALSWAANTKYPKVFKLKGGAGSSNVKLVNSPKEAASLIGQSFGKGFRQYRWKEQFSEYYEKYKEGKVPLKNTLRPAMLALKRYPTPFDHYQGKEIGYAYFQDFVPNNMFDIRVCVIGDKAFALKRMTRKNDFRASGSGSIVYDKQQIDERCVQIAFEVNSKLCAQSLAFDFVFDEDHNPKIVEISYGYAVKAYDSCEGYWTQDMQWHEGTHFDFCGWMVEELLNENEKVC